MPPRHDTSLALGALPRGTPPVPPYGRGRGHAVPRRTTSLTPFRRDHDNQCRLTDAVGAKLAEFPVEPRAGRMLLASLELGCAEEALTVAAVLSVESVFSESRRAPPLPLTY